MSASEELRRRYNDSHRREADDIVPENPCCRGAHHGRGAGNCKDDCIVGAKNPAKLPLSR
jgi:hypothetical protein